MESTIFTPRLKLTLVTKAGRGSQELEWLHELRSDEKATFWSIIPRSKTIEDTAKIMTSLLPNPNDIPKSYKVAYLIHRILESESNTKEPANQPTELIGIVRIHSLDNNHLPLPENLTLPASELPTTLPTEIAYMFLPKSWGKGYATEAVHAVLAECSTVKDFWAPYEKVYVRALVNDGNPASQRVMKKAGMELRGIYEWTGKAIFIAGEWREKDTLWIFGKYLFK
ncbi:GNAT domain-containing protein [Dendryphion nanum]|uniref:GNAT domain-containing protein n=1 Tax=Dendryphion nanum TaxID=256645 RepID=A0A9P9DXX7_9PLEO|nr:GNAT domain-containing protein [Dendryphion nanum]